MKNKLKLIILILLFITFLGIDLALFYFKIFTYLIVLSVITVTLIISILLEIKKLKMDDNQKYLHLLQKMLKVYNPILVETKNFPDVKNRSILKVGDMNDLINAQCEIKKPVYYIKTNDSTLFYLLDNDVMLVHFIKIHDNISTPLENQLDNLNSLNKGKTRNDIEVL